MAQNMFLQDDAYHYLYQQIKDGVFETDKIYSLNVIAGMLKMSKTPVRDALQKLVQEDLLECLPSRGFRLKQVTDKDIAELYELRCAIEGYCCYSLALRLKETKDDSFLLPIRQNLDLQKKIIEDGKSVTEFLPVDQEFHNLLLVQLNNKKMERIIELYRDRINIYALRSLSRDGLLELTLKEHTAVFDAICQKDPYASQAAMFKHFKTAITR